MNSREFQKDPDKVRRVKMNTESTAHRSAIPQWMKLASISTLVFTLFVILWGAFVRKTHSGAGCGDHWPLCNGEVVPNAPSIETLIEFTHRLTSGIAFLGVTIICIGCFKVFERGHAVRKPAFLSLVFMIIEALLGAGLVIFGLVESNDSVIRAASACVHLANTFVLLGFMMHTTLILITEKTNIGKSLFESKLDLFFGFILILIAGFGAVASLGNTLFPATSLIDGMTRHVDITAHFLQRLKVIHPILAVLGGIGIIAAIQVRLSRQNNDGVWKSGQLVCGLIITNLALGALDIALLAPTWLSMIHLLFADLIWLAFIWYLFEKSLHSSERTS